jgi:hypothetical protein
MGYTTLFTGRFTLDRPLSPEHFTYLNAFSEVDHRVKPTGNLETLPDPIRRAAGLPPGKDGEYVIDSAGKFEFCAQPVGNKPEIFCKWIPSADGQGIEWNGMEKFYDYIGWLEYLIVHFLERWGYTLNGSVEFKGEEYDDYGIIVVKDNWIDVFYNRRRAKLPPTHRHTWRR